MEILSKHRIGRPIVAFTPYDHICRQMVLLYGVVPIRYERANQVDQMLADFDRILVERDLAARGDQIIIVAHTRQDLPGNTELLFTHIVGSDSADSSSP